MGSATGSGFFRRRKTTTMSTAKTTQRAVFQIERRGFASCMKRIVPQAHALITAFTRLSADAYSYFRHWPPAHSEYRQACSHANIAAWVFSNHSGRVVKSSIHGFHSTQVIHKRSRHRDSKRPALHHSRQRRS